MQRSIKLFSVIHGKPKVLSQETGKTRNLIKTYEIKGRETIAQLYALYTLSMCASIDQKEDFVRDIFTTMNVTEQHSQVLAVLAIVAKCMNLSR